MSASLIFSRGQRLLLLGPSRPRTALILALHSLNFDVEGDWVCQVSPSGLVALPNSLHWNERLGRSYPEILAFLRDKPCEKIDTGFGYFWTWCPAAEGRPWRCREGPVDGIVVTSEMAGGYSIASQLSSDMAWGHLMSARSGESKNPAIVMELRHLSATAPAIKLSVGNLLQATEIIVQFSSSLRT